VTHSTKTLEQKYIENILSAKWSTDEGGKRKSHKYTEVAFRIPIECMYHVGDLGSISSQLYLTQLSPHIAQTITVGRMCSNKSTKLEGGARWTKQNTVRYDKIDRQLPSNQFIRTCRIQSNSEAIVKTHRSHLQARDRV
jgi:hypothetical protein